MSGPEPTAARLPAPVLYGHVDLVGRSYAYLDCGFCGRTLRVFIWSFAGGGKRCPCGAKHSRSGSAPPPKR